MSTLKTTNIQHPSAGSPNLVLAADGSVSGGAGLGGLVHIHTEDVTSATSYVTINNVFSSEYSSYRIVMNSMETATSGFIKFQPTSSGTPESSSNYFWSYDGSRHNATTFVTSGSNDTSFIFSTGRNTGIYGGGVLDLFDINAAKRTAFVSNVNVGEPSYYNRFSAGGVLDTTGQYDGLKIFHVSSTLTGTIRIYGYAND